MRIKILRPKDIIAIIIIVGVVVMKFYGIDSGLNGAIGMMMGYYFVKRESGQDIGH